jgi:hypothetical protein
MFPPMLPYNVGMDTALDTPSHFLFKQNYMELLYVHTPLPVPL